MVKELGALCRLLCLPWHGPLPFFGAAWVHPVKRLRRVICDASGAARRRHTYRSSCFDSAPSEALNQYARVLLPQADPSGEVCFAGGWSGVQEQGAILLGIACVCFYRVSLVFVGVAYGP